MGEHKTNDQLIEEIKGYWNNIQRLTNDMYIRPNKLSTEELMEEFEYPQSKPAEQKSRIGYFAGAPDRTTGTRGDPNNPLIPLVVPTLDREEIDLLASGGEPTDRILHRARVHAQDRIDQGLSPFAGVDEVRELPVKKENSMKLDVFLKKLSKASIPTGALEVELPDAKGEKKEVDIKATKVVKDAGAKADMLKALWKSMSKKDVALLGGAAILGGTAMLIPKPVSSKWDKLEDYGCHEVLDSVGEIKSIASRKGMNLNKLYNRVVAPYESKIERDDNGSFARKVLKPRIDKEIKRMKTSSLDSFLVKFAESQLEMGREVEKEHAPTYDKIQKNMPELDEFAEMIAKDHLAEMPEDYYTKLKEMEKGASVADFLKRLGTKTKPEQKPEGLLKLIDDIKPKEDPMQKLLELEIQKGGAFNLNQVLKELEAKATKGAMTSTVKNPVKNMYNQMGGTVPTKDVLDYWLKREGRRIVR